MELLTDNVVVKTAICTGLALVAFAANSVLCRMALGSGAIDPAGFTAVRLLSGAVVLGMILKLTGGQADGGADGAAKGGWPTAVMLAAYAAAFSFAYVSLEIGTGALILFGAVQFTIILVAVIQGDRLHLLEWLGVLIAFGGFVYLILPGVAAPSWSGFALMSLAGVAWGLYTLWGRGSRNPLADTASNFIRTAPLALLLLVVAAIRSDYTGTGLLLAGLSGAIASGLGYTLWYTAMRGLSAAQAAVVQSGVPIIAAVGGVIFAAEAITFRLAASTVLILGGVLTTVLGRYYWTARKKIP